MFHEKDFFIWMANPFIIFKNYNKTCQKFIS